MLALEVRRKVIYKMFLTIIFTFLAGNFQTSILNRVEMIDLTVFEDGIVVKQDIFLDLNIFILVKVIRVINPVDLTLTLLLYDTIFDIKL